MQTVSNGLLSAFIRRPFLALLEHLYGVHRAKKGIERLKDECSHCYSRLTRMMNARMKTNHICGLVLLKTLHIKSSNLSMSSLSIVMHAPQHSHASTNVNSSQDLSHAMSGSMENVQDFFEGVVNSRFIVVV